MPCMLSQVTFAGDRPRLKFEDDKGIASFTGCQQFIFDSGGGQVALENPYRLKKPSRSPAFKFVKQGMAVAQPDPL
jgi:hypothetical protein